MAHSESKPALWSFPTELSAAEEQICKRLQRTGRLFAFLRRHRHELFDEAFQLELLTMYTDTPRGTPPRPPALLAMVTLLQAYEQKSDAAAVEEALFDRRWQMVLDGLGADTPLFSQGVLVEFRRRLIAHDMDKRLIERTVELARKSGAFGHTQLRLALDSAPLWGTGRVEDTFNLIGHALRLVAECAAQVSGMPVETLCQAAQLTLVGQSSIKAALDIDWDDEQAQHLALERLMDEVEKLRRYVREHLEQESRRPPLEQALSALEAVIEQDLEPDPGGGPGLRIKQGVARDRRISISDPEMRHGRKSRTRTINGYKRHVVRDLESGLLLGACVRPANEPEADAAEDLRQDVAIYGEVASLSIDRGYLASLWVKDLYEAGKEILAKAWSFPQSDLFTKADFEIDLESALVRCPQGQEAPIRGQLAQFKAETCHGCPQRARCTKSKQGRSIRIHEQEQMLLSLRELQRTSEGREKLRERVEVEHSLAHVCQRQGPRARYLGVRKNTFDVRRTAVIVNLHTIDRLSRAA